MEVICQFMSLLVEHFDWNVVPTTPQVFCMCPILNKLFLLLALSIISSFYY